MFWDIFWPVFIAIVAGFAVGNYVGAKIHFYVANKWLKDTEYNEVLDVIRKMGE